MPSLRLLGAELVWVGKLLVDVVDDEAIMLLLVDVADDEAIMLK